MSNQIIVLGMHRSGTSLATNLICLMGAYFGPKDMSIGESWENLKGFWERRDVIDINARLFYSINADWKEVFEFNLNKVSLPEYERFKLKANKIVKDLNENLPCVIKDPRFCMVFRAWRPLLKKPIGIIVHRNPIEIAFSLKKRNNIPIPVGIAIWESYIKSALNGTIGLPRIIVNYNKLIANPVMSIDKLVNFFKVVDTKGLKPLNRKIIKETVSPGLYRNRIDPVKIESYLTQDQLKLFNSLEDESILKWEKIPPVAESAKDLSLLHKEFQDLTTIKPLLNRLCMSADLLFQSKQYGFARSIGRIIRRILHRESYDIKSEIEMLEVLNKYGEHRLFNRKNNLNKTLFQKKCCVVKKSIGADYIQHRAQKSSDTNPKVDIVVCVHNALDFVKKTLNSIENTITHNVHTFIVNDGSDSATSDYLKEFTNKWDWCTLIINEKPLGYTLSVNKGMKATSGDIVILLNSDVEVPERWVERIARAINSAPNIGIVGPLSNAATLQSIPRRYNSDGSWAINGLPHNLSIKETDDLVNYISEEKYPKVPLINGFCFAIYRAVIEKIGYFDELNFPRGYGEENDYCLRATAVGFKCAIVDNLYIYHHKSKSFGSSERNRLSKIGNHKLRKKHGKTVFKKAVFNFKNEKTLRRLRTKFRIAVDYKLSDGSTANFENLSIMFLLPCAPGGGGAHSVVQEANQMLKLGIDTVIAIPELYRAEYLKNYGNEYESVFYFYVSTIELINISQNYTFVIATIFTSVKILKRIMDSNRDINSGYYIQDYEPWIVTDNLAKKIQAYRSYNSINNMVRFAKTNWLCEIVKKKHRLHVEKVVPSLDRSVYFSDENLAVKFSTDILNITAMVRPKTPRRAAGNTLKLFKIIKEKYGQRINLHIFGSTDQELSNYKLKNISCIENHGILIREEVAELLRMSHIFIDLSVYQAFGRTGLEAMACGCIPVLPIKGGATEYAIHRWNSLLIDTSSIKTSVLKISKLIDNDYSRQRLSENVIETSKRYSCKKAALSIMLVLLNHLEKKRV